MRVHPRLTFAASVTARAFAALLAVGPASKLLGVSHEVFACVLPAAIGIGLYDLGAELTAPDGLRVDPVVPWAVAMAVFVGLFVLVPGAPLYVALVAACWATCIGVSIGRLAGGPSTHTVRGTLS